MVSACCDVRVHCVRLHGCADPSRASHAAALLQRWQPEGSSHRCHCTPRVPSTDSASSRAGVVGRVHKHHKGLRRASACLSLDLRAAHSRLHTRPCWDGMVAPLMLECNPDVRSGPCSVQVPCLHQAPASPPSPQTQICTFAGHLQLVSTAAKSGFLQKWCCCAPLVCCSSRCTIGQWRCSLQASPPICLQPTNFHAH